MLGSPICIPHDRRNLAFDLRMGGCPSPESARRWLLSRESWLGSWCGGRPGSLRFPSMARAGILRRQDSRGVCTGGLGLRCPLLQKAEPLKRQHGELGLLTWGGGHRILLGNGPVTQVSA